MSALEPVIGLEVHVQLRTAHKLFCADSTAFGADPNTNVCPVCLGLPGALPVLNEEAVELALRAALALGCRIHGTSVFARKNYFYPDLPKGYQISQFDRPLATEGRVEVASGDATATVRIRRVHLEEDAGKSLHDRYESATAVDLNRTGVPLVEIVTEPDLPTPEAARAYLQTLKRMLEYLDVSDCNMEEGSLRVDANVSLRPAGSDTLGTKTEIKNLNSFSGVEKALHQEIERHRKVLGGGGAIVQETLLWDQARGELRSMRSKEESHDYRYFPDPDLPPLVIEDQRLARVETSLPELPGRRLQRFVDRYGLPPYDADVLTASRELADYFEEVAGRVADPKVASNWVMGPVLEIMKEGGGEGGFPVAPDHLADLIALVEGGRISGTMGKTVLRTIVGTGERPAVVVDREGLAQISDDAMLVRWVDEVLAVHPEEVGRYRDGEAKLLGFFVGRVMRASGGKADPRRVNEILSERLAAPDA